MHGEGDMGTMIASTGMPGISVEIDQRYEEYIVGVGMSSITSRFRILSMPARTGAFPYNP